MTGPAVGVRTVLGFSPAESIYGTPVTVDRFFELLNETLGKRTNILQSQGMRGGTRGPRRGSRRALSSHDAGGDINFEVATTGFGNLWLAILGGSVVTTSLGGSPAAYQHVFSMGSLVGKSYTVQKQLRDSANALVQTLTYPGSKVMDAELSIAVNQLLLLKLTLDCIQEKNDVAAASASYTNQKLFNFSQVTTLTVGGAAAANVTAAALKLTNPQKTDRYFLGSAGLKGEPTDSDYAQITGSLTTEVLDEVLYTLFKNDTAAALQAKWVGALISGANSMTLQIDVPEIHFTGKSPEVGGFGEVENQVPFEAAYDGTNPGITVTVITTDATP